MQISEHLKSELENERRNTKQTLRTSLAGCEVNERLVNKFGSVKDRWISDRLENCYYSQCKVLNRYKMVGSFFLENKIEFRKLQEL